MICPFCQTENRDDRGECYYCDKDLSMLRLIVNKAKHHYNQGLEYAERGHIDDAIAEIQNSLDLDGSLIEAQLVLGSLHAKKEMYDKARACWSGVLASNHAYEKSHNYLIKAESAEVVFPAMRRLQMLSIVLLGLLFVTLGVIVYVSLPDRGLQTIGQAVELMRADDAKAGQALALLDEMVEDSSTSTLANQLATGLREQILAAWNRRLNMARQSLTGGDPHLTLELIGALDAPGIPNTTIVGAAASMRDHANEEMVASVDRAADEYYDGRVAFEDFEKQADQYLRLAPQSKENARIAELLEQVRADSHKKLLAQAGAEVTEASSTAEAVIKVVDWEARYPELTESLRGLLDARLELEAAQTESEVARLLKAGKGDQARERIDMLKLVYESAHRPIPQDTLERLENLMVVNERRSALEQANEAFGQGQWLKFVELTEQIDALTTDADERAQLAAKRIDALDQYAMKQWDWFHKRDGKFEDGRISAEEAAAAVEHYARVIENLPASLRYARGPLLFYAASSYTKLGRIAEARQLLDRVRLEHPKSYIIQSVDQFTQRFHDQLNPEVQPETEQSDKNPST